MMTEPLPVQAPAADNYAAKVASDLLSIHAVTLSPAKPFVWASGLHTPIYCDNRLTIGYPSVRRDIYEGMSRMIAKSFPGAEVIGGVATAGIPHAAWVSEQMHKPMIYVRSKPKDHGRGRQIEGVLNKGQKVVLIDDLISTGGSVLKAVEAVRKEGGDVLGVACIFTYELAASYKNFAEAGLQYHAVTDYSTMLRQAEAENYVSHEDVETLAGWSNDPQEWSREHGGE